MNKSKLILGAAALTPIFGGAVAEAATKPDILFIFVDDMVYDGIAALGHRQVKTPNVDRLVESGVSFVNNYNMGGWSGALSMASRTQLITGKYLWNAFNESKKDKFKGMTSNRQMWPQIMTDNGYKSFHTGKWHVAGVNPANIFDEVSTVRPGMPGDNFRTTRVGYNRPQSREDNAWQPWDTSMGGHWAGGKHWSEVQADVIIDYMERNEESDKPLFMTCAFNAPHDPRQSPKEYVDMYNVDEMELPASFMPEHPYMEEMRSGRTVRDEQLAPFPRTEYAVKKHMQEYYAIITFLDVQIGRILDALEESGRADNTVIFFTADNGLAMGRHGFLGKQSLYEHSLKTPMIVVGKGFPKGEKREQPVYLQDLVPTSFELAGIEKPASVDFNSLLPIVMDKKAKSNYDYVYNAYINLQRTISDGRYKLLFINEAKKFYLFDLDKDPEEITDLSQSKKHQEIIKRLAAKFIEKAKEMNDSKEFCTPEYLASFGIKL